MTVTSTGDIATAGNITVENSTTLNSGSQTNFYLKGNHFCKNGISVAGGTYSADCFNMLYSGGMHLFVGNTDLGVITTSSDYRIKKDVVDLPSTWEQVKALRPIKYTQAEFTTVMSEETQAAHDEVTKNDPQNKTATTPVFQADDIERWGFIAHELQETLLPSASSGVKDMEDGVQSPNWPPIVAALTKALQEAMARIEALEAKLV
jgi:hypothetical protein